MAAATGAVAALDETRRVLKEESRDDLRFRAALHLGDIHYGNSGSRSRLDFTAVGPSVNLAARLMSVADELAAETVCSEVFSSLVPGSAERLGDRTFKGFAESHAIFGLRRS